MAAENGLYVFKLGLRGDASAELVWKYQRSVPQLPSLVVYRDVVYMLNDHGVLTTLDAATGRMLRQDRVCGLSENYYASPVAGDGKIFLASHNGVAVVLRAGGKQELLAANPLEEEIFATPAIANGRLYVRTVSALYCFGMRDASSSFSLKAVMVGSVRRCVQPRCYGFPRAAGASAVSEPFSGLPTIDQRPRSLPPTNSCLRAGRGASP
jgi:hypothetical protein